ncbi:T9SS type A sorting domain-containing protein [Roseivirga pacifica]|uniref:T9SS type A sorting domain-containing protein n=1 Tax=Roseivirga pacifica TaxID=1267423 RepID=UPI003BB209FC
MKRFFLLLIALNCSVVTNLFAQSTDFSTKINHVFEHVDRGPVLTGLLWDYGFQFVDVLEYDGVIRTDNYLGGAEWRGLYASLYSQAFNMNFSLSDLDSYNSVAKNQQSIDGETVNFMMLHIEYNKLKSNAVTSNLMSVSNDQLYDVSGRQSSPYEVKRAFAISPTSHNLDGSTHSFKLRQNLFVTNSGKTLSGRYIDLGDGQGYRSVNWNSTVSATYSSDGIKTVKVKLTFTDGTSLESHSKIKVINTVQPTAVTSFDPSCGRNFINTPPVITASRSYQGVTASAELGIRYGQGHCNNEIINPLIIVEGFDTDFEFNIFSTLFSDPLEPQSLDVEIDSNGTPLSSAIGDGTDLSTYDIIYVDLLNPTTYIEANAYMLQEVIHWVNAQKSASGSTSDNVVLGISMGGLISRYALADMEDRNDHHDTRLLITHDTPHQGANVPPAFQAFYRHASTLGIQIGIGGTNLPFTESINLSFASIIDAFDIDEGQEALTDQLDMLNSPAAREMLIHQVGLTTSANPQLYIDNSEHVAFMQRLHSQGLSGSNGYPTRWGIRTVVMSNGSECGGGQGFQPYDNLLFVGGSNNLNYLTGLLIGFRNLHLNKYYLLGNLLLGLASTDTDLKTEFIFKAVPNQQSKRIYKGKIEIEREILFLINVTSTVTDKSLFSNTSMLPYDSSSGGAFDLEELADLDDLPLASQLVNPRFAFVPTTSALDVGGGSTTLTASDLVASYSVSAPPTGSKSIPADNFITGFNENEIHTLFNYRNGNFLLDELDQTSIFVECQGFCSVQAAGINGTNLVCSSPASSFSLASLPSGAQVSWSVSNGLEVVSQSGSSASIKSTIGQFGTGEFTTVNATIQTDCGDIELQKTVWAGPPNAYTLNQDGSKNYMGGSRSYSVSPGTQSISVFSDSPGTSYTWSMYPSSIQWTSYGNTATFYTNTAGSYTLTATANNGCSTHPYFITINIGDGGGFGGFSLTTYPNPSSDEMTVDLIPSIDTSTADRKLNSYPKEEYLYQLINHKQEVVFSRKTKKRSTKIPSRNFPKGQYILKVSSKEESISKHIIIN